jgi:hypothetical protein
VLTQPPLTTTTTWTTWVGGWVPVTLIGAMPHAEPATELDSFSNSQ